MSKRPISICALGVTLAFAQSPPSDRGVLLRGGTVHTLSGPVIENGSVLVHNGKIIGVGKNLSAPEGFQVIDIPGQQVYPGMIDAASRLGLETKSDEEASDAREIGLINPQLRAATAVNPSSELIPAARSNGVTTVIEMPEGELIAGQMSVVHLDASGNNSDMTLVPSTAIHLRFPAIVTVPIPPHEADEDDDPAAYTQAEPIPYPEARRAYNEKMRELNRFFEEARRYRQAKLAKPDSLPTDLRYEAMLSVLDGKTPMFVTAVREREIREAIQFARKEKIRIILADAYEAYKVLPLLKSSNTPVVLGPTHTLPLDRDDPYDRSFTTPADLYKAGVQFCIATFSSRLSRNLPYEAAAAVPFGLPHDEAYKAVSLNAAQIFGIANRLGSIEEGKTADLIVTDGDPLEVKTHVNLMFIDGKPIDLNTRQKQLYEKYSGRH
ncbi:MAG TPA: amidohydrolase family protein [Bryobacteraceae bacterium]|nr:amidohydrolase family protein [Bryobacteraceae bacterium]